MEPDCNLDINHWPFYLSISANSSTGRSNSSRPPPPINPMAFFRVAVHFFCFVLLLAFSTPRAQARESQFFSKAERYTAPKEATPGKEESPTAKTDEDVQYKPDGGYGLYGHDPEKIPAATTASPTFPTYSYNNAGEKFNTESVPSEFSNEEFNGVSYGNKEFNAAGYPDNKNYAGNTPTYKAGSIPQSEINGYKYNKEANTRYPSYANQDEQYGMSDTRFLDNGRYFYDLKAENSYRNSRYDPARGNPGGDGSFGGGQTFANGGYTYGNNNNINNNEEGDGYEENNSMQGYQNNQKEEYVP